MCGSFIRLISGAFWGGLGGLGLFQIRIFANEYFIRIIE
ncbi:hypothetical protein BSMD_000840 [Bacillus subtilis Miyagi-4]|nr:hypothetical protein BSNT_10065 [Bacillus subtilis subsp. natto BEST195]GAK78188.1 hypothetical protein BSMD_000840 [Bacillus subtilis Miyagi-4]